MNSATVDHARGFVGEYDMGTYFEEWALNITAFFHRIRCRRVETLYPWAESIVVEEFNSIIFERLLSEQYGPIINVNGRAAQSIQIVHDFTRIRLLDSKHFLMLIFAHILIVNEFQNQYVYICIHTYTLYSIISVYCRFNERVSSNVII